MNSPARSSCSSVPRPRWPESCRPHGRGTGPAARTRSCRTTSGTSWTTSLRLSERIAAFRALLQNALAVNAALVAQRQNDEMRLLTESSFAQNEQVKRISSWAAILFAPTLIGTIYGMNFRDMPELDWIFGYPMALGLMVGMGWSCTGRSSTTSGSDVLAACGRLT